jgi:DNA polymerase I-like protein with 3'-5' exonuclease and polymerase domains
MAQEQGFIRENGTKNLKSIRDYIEEHVENPLLTKKGQIATSKEALEAANIKELADFNHTQKLLSTYVPALEGGVNHPINAFFRPLVETGRVSCRRPNLMNLPRFPGVRECFVPREGYVFCTVDYDTLELCTLAQCCIWLVGQSELGEAINAGLDPHLDFAANMMGIEYEHAKELKAAQDEEVKHYRQLAKVANFGLPGGLGAKKFVKFAAGQDVFITLEEATALKNQWLHQWPEMHKYFGAINRLVGHTGEGTLVQFVSNRVRGGVTYTAACNSYFQGLAADGAKEANFRIQKECYIDTASVLFGSRMSCFVHDETILEHPIEDAHIRADRQADVMCEAMQTFVPDIKIKASPALMFKWYKDAEGVYDAKGKLIPWEPEPKKEAA